MADTGTLVLSHICATNLRLTDTPSAGDLNPYVVFALGNQEATTDVAKHPGAHPIWKDCLELKSSSFSDSSDLLITVHNKAHLLPDDFLGTAAVPLSKITFGHPTRVSLQGGKHGPSVAGELAFTMEKHGQSHVVGSYDDTGRPLQATGDITRATEGEQRGVYEEKGGGIPATGGVGGGGAAVFLDQGVKTGPEFDPRQLGTGTAGTGHHEEVYEDHGHHVTGTAGVTGGGATVYSDEGVHTGKQFDPKALE